MTEQATILIVDDDPAILENAVDLLRVSGYHVLSAKNGLEALQVLQSRMPDLIVSDIMMPEMDGYALYQAVRDNPAWTLIPFLFLSAKGEQKDIRRGYELGADLYLTKPFEPDDLLTAVQTRLKRFSEIQAAAQAPVEEMKSNLITIFNHELRTPLTYIYGYLRLLQDDYQTMDGDTINHILGDMQKGTDRLVGLVEELMLLAQLDSGLIERQVAQLSEDVPLSSKIDQVINELYPTAEKKHIAISAALPKDLLVFGIGNYLQDIFRRLIDNAIKFGKPGGEVLVKAAADKEEPYVSVTVQDDGVGISSDQQKYIFDLFRQIDRETMEQQGVGIGLTIADRLVRLHGGTIQVESEPGVGSTFTVTLPIQR